MVPSQCDGDQRTDMESVGVGVSVGSGIYKGGTHSHLLNFSGLCLSHL